MNKETLAKWKEECRKTLHDWQGLSNFSLHPTEVLSLIEKLERYEKALKEIADNDARTLLCWESDVAKRALEQECK